MEKSWSIEDWKMGYEDMAEINLNEANTFTEEDGYFGQLQMATTTVKISSK